MVHGHNDDEVQALPHAGTLGLLFLATRAESRSLCVGIALVLQGMHRQASSASWHVLLSHRLEPKALHAEHMLQETRFAKRYLVPCFKQGPQGDPLLYVHDCS